MVSKANRLKKVRQNPKAVTFHELAQVLYDHGFHMHRTTGSHVVFKRSLGDGSLSYPIPRHGKTVKPVYVKQILALIDTHHLKFKEDDND